ncbi:MAG: single-stranded-DNA-specific exonuclease RecJ [Verrucomicrobia bacterium]|nr:single-stranded-DNA-specific exonuclease RecJ [Verrucomicrobiota bacterium]MBS0646547.1 single-stranded-DNA-specific exonuclease RecJ [Verrucomicrobiota bacterium]
MEDLPSLAPVWVYPKVDNDWVQAVAQNFHVHTITAQILVSRGFQDFDQIHEYFYSKLPDLIDPGKLLDMQKAVKRIMAALEKQEGILIYGDNDVDGMTGTVLLTEFLRRIGARVEYYVPHHNIQRYELFLDAIEFAKAHQCTLMITVDCGITAAKELHQVIANGIDVIITDHHEPTEKLPNCVATLNPKLINQTYPNRDLTGVGVAFKLAHAITNYFFAHKLPMPKKIDLKVYLDLVALGTIADMGVLLAENRVLVRYGLKQIQKTKRIGLAKLFQICGVNCSDATPIDIASKIAPRLNSLGRIADPRKGVELLLLRDEKRAEELAKELDLFNVERQKIEQLVSTEVDDWLSKHINLLSNKALVLKSANWHPGVIPIVAARIAKHYNRPTVIIAVDGSIGKGSIRTIREFPLLPILKKSADLFLNYGGHDFAAGFTIPENLIDKFAKRFIHAANSSLKDHDMISKLHLDAQADFKDLCYDLLSSFELFEPYGNENTPPILYCQARQAWAPKVIGGTHLKLYLEQDDRMLEGIAFGMADRRAQIQKKNILLQVAYTPQINHFHNKSSIQLLIKDFKVIEETERK